MVRGSSIVCTSGHKIAFLAAASLAAGSASVHAGFSDRWALIHETGVETGYDSNVFGSSRDDEVISDGYVQFSQRASLTRRNSLTRLEAEAEINALEYFSESTASSIDGQASLTAGYPLDKVQPQTWAVDIQWSNASTADLTLAERVRLQSLRAGAEGLWEFSPKLGAVGAVAVGRSSYAEDRYNTNTSLSFTSGIAHLYSPKLSWSGEYSFESARSVPNLVGARRANSDIHTFGGRARGELTGKVAGSVFAGYALAKFSGDTRFSDSGPALSANLTWDASEQTTAKTELSYRFSFSPEGAATKSLQWQVSVERSLSVALTAGASASLLRADYSEEVLDRSDTGWSALAFVSYGISRYWNAGASAGYAANDSSLSRFDADRAFVLLNASFKY